MHADKRNASVVVALIAALTCGSMLLLWLEAQLVPKKRNWEGNTLLMAQRERHVDDVEVFFSERIEDVPASAVEEAESLCRVFDDGSLPAWDGDGPRVRLFVVGAGGAAEKLSDAQKHALLGVLGTLSRMSGRDALPVRLAPASDVNETAGLPRPAADLRDFLERKGFIDRHAS